MATELLMHFHDTLHWYGTEPDKNTSQDVPFVARHPDTLAADLNESPHSQLPQVPETLHTDTAVAVDNLQLCDISPGQLTT